MLQNLVLFTHVLCYQYYCFCSLDEALRIKTETQIWCGAPTWACLVVPPASGKRCLRLQAHTVSHCLPCTGRWCPEHRALDDTERKQTSTATSNSLPTVNKAEMGAAKRPIHHHPATSNISALLANCLYTRSSSHNAHLSLLSHRFFMCSAISLWAVPESSQISTWSPEKMGSLSLQMLSDLMRPGVIKLLWDWLQWVNEIKTESNCITKTSLAKIGHYWVFSQ